LQPLYHAWGGEAGDELRVVGSSLGVAVARTLALFSWWLPLACGLGVLLIGIVLEQAPRAGA
jgi:hypothetical protein